MKNDYKQQTLTGLIYYTNIKDLTIQDVYGAMVLLTRERKLRQVSKSLWTKKQFEYLYQQVIDGDSSYFLSDFKEAVFKTRRDRHKQHQHPIEDYQPDYFNPEENMEAISDILLRDDEVYFSF